MIIIIIIIIIIIVVVVVIYVHQGVVIGRVCRHKKAFHGNRGRSGTNFTCTVKFADPDNPLLGAGMGVVFPIQAELFPISC